MKRAILIIAIAVAVPCSYACAMWYAYDLGYGKGVKDRKCWIP